MEEANEITFMFDKFMLGLLAVAFTAWAGVVWQGLRKISDKFDMLKQGLMDHLIKIERRLTSLEVIAKQRKEQEAKKVLKLHSASKEI